MLLRYRFVASGLVLPGDDTPASINVAAKAKCNQDDRPFAVPAEMICAEIARFIGLPAPPGALAQASNAKDVWFASLDFNQLQDDLPPIDPEAFVELCPSIATGVVLFDILVANPDRHDHNLWIKPYVDPVEVAVFDHDLALFGDRVDKALQRLADLDDRLGVAGGSVTGFGGHCLIGVLDSDEYFGEWIERIESMPDDWVRRCCDAVVGVGLTPELATAAASFLNHRKRKVRDLIDARRKEFKGIQTWSLFT